MTRYLVLVLGFWAAQAQAQSSPTTTTTPNGFTFVVNGGLLYTGFPGNGASNRFDIAILGDGYTLTEQDLLTAAARTCVTGLFQVTPYSEACVNVWVVNLVSKESGIDDPRAGLWQDTALDCSFATTADPYMKITGDYDKCLEVCTTAGVPNDAIYVLVHDVNGHNGAYGDNNAGIAFSSDMYPWGTIMAHELGHVVAHLADEYRHPDCSDTFNATYNTGYIPSEPNVTTATDSALVPWADLMTTRAFPTTIDSVCNAETIGRWEGADQYCFNIYRPREYCLMDGVTGDDPDEDGFCPVCVRAITDSLATRFGCAPP